MSKFKVGDRVKIAESSGYYHTGDDYNPDCTGTVDDAEDRILVKWDNGIRNGYTEKDLVLSNRRVHADLIIAWAEGAEIEKRRKSDGRWFTVMATPVWFADYEYRVKLDKSPKEIEKEEILAKIDELEIKVSELKNKIWAR